MIKIVTSSEMREMDRHTIEDLGVPGVVLMENAGVGTFRVIQRLLENTAYPEVWVFCGKGNNGGDGFVIARHLWDAGNDVRVFIVGEETDLKGDALINFQIVKNFGITHHFVKSIDKLPDPQEYSPALIVDALLGTGIKGAVKGFMKEVIEYINDCYSPVVAVDVPSGLNADSPAVEGVAVQADVTVTMGLPKRCHVFYPAKEYVGELFIADIGIPHTVRSTPEVGVQMVEKSDIILPLREPDTHKYQVGKVAVLAGSAGYTGAASLTAEAALKMGAGLVILGIPEPLNPILETKLTEVITRPYPSADKSYLVPESLSEVKELLEWCDVLAIGPGLGRTPETIETIREILTEFEKPAVIDADALFAISQYSEILKGEHPNWILTPHHGEFLRLLSGVGKERLQNEFVELARQFARDRKVNLLLKGAPSLVVGTDGQVYVNSTGNAGLASGGTGDVLTGLVAGLMVQGLSPVIAGYSANYLHGLIADELAEQETIYSLTAGDLIAHLGQTLRKHFFTQGEQGN